MVDTCIRGLIDLLIRVETFKDRLNLALHITYQVLETVTLEKTRLQHWHEIPLPKPLASLYCDRRRSHKKIEDFDAPWYIFVSSKIGFCML